jgi:hypothetical protein
MSRALSPCGATSKRPAKAVAPRETEDRTFLPLRAGNTASVLAYVWYQHRKIASPRELSAVRFAIKRGSPFLRIDVAKWLSRALTSSRARDTARILRKVSISGCCRPKRGQNFANRIDWPGYDYGRPRCAGLPDLEDSAAQRPPRAIAQRRICLNSTGA